QSGLTTPDAGTAGFSRDLFSFCRRVSTLLHLPFDSKGRACDEGCGPKNEWEREGRRPSHLLFVRLRALSFVCAPPRTGRVRDPRISIFNIFDGGLSVRPCIESPAPEEQEGRGWMVRGVAFLRPMTLERCAARLAMVRWKPDLASGRET